MKIKIKADVEIRDERGSQTPIKECHIDIELETKHAECEALESTYFQVSKMMWESLHG